MMTKVRCGWLPGLILVLAASAHAASLVCRFADDQGRPLRGVEIRLTPAGSEAHQFHKSDKQGVATFKDLKARPYELRAQLKGYVPVRNEFEFTDDQALEFTFLSKQAFGQLDDQASEALRRQDYAQATLILERLLKFYPFIAELHDNRARAAAGLGDEPRALAEADRAAQLNPQLSRSRKEIERFLLRARGEQALGRRDFAAAAKLFEQLTALAPNYAEGYYGLALACGHQGRIEEALLAINRAIELDSPNSSYLKVKEILGARARGK